MSCDQPRFPERAAIYAGGIQAALVLLGGCGQVQTPDRSSSPTVTELGTGGTIGGTTGGAAAAATTASSGGLTAIAQQPSGGTAGGSGVGGSGSPSVTNPDAPLVSGSDPANTALRAIATLRVAATRRCSGALVRASDAANAQAYLLTSGRCALDPTLPSAGPLVDTESDLGIKATFGRFRDGTLDAPEISVPRVVYATLNGTDLALLEIDRSPAELAALGIEPLRLRFESPNVGDPLRVVGTPVGYLDGSYESADFIRESRCSKLASATVVEHHFMWFDELVSRCPGMGEGAEGAPVLNQNGEVTAIHHRLYGDATPNAPCFYGNPCEVGGGAPERVERGRTYAVPVSKLSGCFRDTGEFDRTREACHLETRAEFRVKDKPSLLMAPGRGRAWAAELASETVIDVRIKTGSLEDTDCRDAIGYSDPVPLDVANQAFASLPLPPSAGLYAMCVVAGSAIDDSSWVRSFEHPTVMVSRLYERRPRLGGAERIDLTPQQAFDIADDVEALYAAHAAAVNARLTATMHPDATLTMDIRESREWRVEIGLNLVQPGRTTPDVAAFLLCHEVGHALGGFPFKAGPEQARQVEGLNDGLYATVSATEGEADYFAGKECLPRLWAGEPSLNARFRDTATPFMRSQCDAVWSTTAERDICYRGAVTAEAVGYWYAPTESLRVDTPDPLVVPGLSDGRSNQCRVDTAFQGALCRTKFRGTTIPGLIRPYEQLLTISPTVEAAAAPDSCTEGVGSRPLCWFKPNATPVDCTGIPADGHCVVVDGHDAQQYCSERGGLETYPCTDEEKCVLDDYGSPYCVPR